MFVYGVAGGLSDMRLEELVDKDPEDKIVELLERLAEGAGARAGER